MISYKEVLSQVLAQMVSRSLHTGNWVSEQFVRRKTV
jgi:hypothetical protein